MRGGRLARSANDAPGFSVEPVSIGRPFAKQELLRRAGQEIAYARVLERAVAQFAPEVVINTNGTMIMSRRLQRAAATRGFAYVHWMQDIHTPTIGYVLRKRFGPLGLCGQGLVRHLEKGVVANADAVIVITDDFNAQLAAYGIQPRLSFTVPNWMPNDEIAPCPKDNGFSREFGLADTFNVLYAGVLGHKHEIAPFLALARVPLRCRLAHRRGRPRLRRRATATGAEGGRARQPRPDRLAAAWAVELVRTFHAAPQRLVHYAAGAPLCRERLRHRPDRRSFRGDHRRRPTLRVGSGCKALS
ncbi:MAG TPA: glycosyltransferase [Reyranella sp.]|nr:glycosyltransferase [Reyranella sp.]